MSATLKIEKARTIAEYLQVFEKIVGDWSGKTGAVRPWCRGHSDANWGLRPGECRPGLICNPNEIRSEFHLRALPLLRRVPASDWEWYFLMQHHGLPTRLLDWTTGSLLALYFAVRDDVGKQDAAVWILDPWALNKRTLKRSELLLSTDEVAQLYLPPIYGSSRRIPKLPAAIVPAYNSERITVQRGTFTVHGTSREGIEEIFGERLVKVVIPRADAVSVKRSLRMSGIGEFTVFPELDGLCREIRAAEIDGC